MIFDKDLEKRTGYKDGKVISILSNTPTEITVSVNGTIHKINTVGKSADEIGALIKSL